MADKPSFYSILTADVRYDERLSFFARVLYSDITAMCNVKGYCSAGNEHFADKFKQSKRTVSGTIARWRSSDISVSRSSEMSEKPSLSAESGCRRTLRKQWKKWLAL